MFLFEIVAKWIIYFSRKTTEYSNCLSILILKNAYIYRLYILIIIFYFSKLSASVMVRVFAHGPGDLGSVPGRDIPKTQKMVLDAALLNTQHCKERIKGKVEQSRERSSAPPTPWCSSYRKRSLPVALDFGRKLHYIYIYIFVWTYL